MSRWANWAVGAATLAAMAACVPIPYSSSPGYRGSRADLGEGVPAFVETGKTTREEIVGRLGTPEVAALDSAWFYYESNYLQSESGVIFVTGGAGGVLPVGASGSSVRVFRRLFVRFADDGVVTETDYQNQTCRDLHNPAEPSVADLQSCAILRRGIELRQERLRARVAAAGEPGAAAPPRRYDGALWKEGAGLPSMWANLRDDPLSCSWKRKDFGTLLISEAAITFLPAERAATGASASVRVERSQLARVELFGPSMVNVAHTAGLELTCADGRVASVTLCDSRGSPAMDRVKEALALLRAPSTQK